MTTSATATSTLTEVSFANLFGIFVSCVLVIMYLVFGAHALKYTKSFACKIKIISNRAEDKNIQMKKFNYDHKEEIRQGPAFKKMETIFKNEIKKSRSLKYSNVLWAYMAKYNHIIYYPFRDKISDKVDLLKPKSTFFNLIVITALCVVWMTTIFISAILQSAYINVSAIPAGTFVGFTVLIAFTSSVVNIGQINRMFRLYAANMKNAFKIDYGHKYTGINQGIRDYSPEHNEFDEELKSHMQLAKQEKKEPEYRITIGGVPTHRTTSRDDPNQNMNSTRKLLFDEVDKSDALPMNYTIKMNYQSQSRSVIAEEDEENPHNGSMFHNNQPPKPRSRHLSPVMSDFKPSSLFTPQGQQKITKPNQDTQLTQGDFMDLKKASSKDKFIFIEDVHAIGDQDLLNNEALKGENKSNIYTFMISFLILAIAAIVCCYLNYTFSTLLSQYIFYMFVAAFLVDALIFRNLLIALMAAIRYLISKKKGYQNIEYKDKKQIKELMNSALRDMMGKRKEIGASEYNTPGKLLGDTHEDPKRRRKFSDIGEITQEYLTQGYYDGYDKHNTTQKQLQMEEQKEDDDAIDIDELGMKTMRSDRKGPKDIKPNNILLKIPSQEENNENYLEKSSVISYNTQMPLQKNVKQQMGDGNDVKYEDIMDKKHIVNELVDYNLLLLRKIYDAFEQRADKVVKNFREDNFNILRKRYMVPVLNPNYNHEDFLKVDPIEEVEEEEVSLDGDTVCEDEGKQQVDTCSQEGMDDQGCRHFNRKYLDKFGNHHLDDENANGVIVALPQPAFGKIDHEAEHGSDDSEDWSSKLKELQMLREKKRSGKTLSESELSRLQQLEKEEDRRRHQDIQSLEAKQNRSAEDESNLQELLKAEEDYRNRRLQELKEKAQTSKLSDDEKEELKALEKWQEDKYQRELQNLQKKQRSGQLSEEEAKRLEELEENDWQTKQAELNELRNKQRRGELLTQEEQNRLRELEQEEIRRKKNLLEQLRIKHKQGDINDEEKKLLSELEEWEESCNKQELEELRTKMKNGTISEEEVRRLQVLEEWEENNKKKQLQDLKDKMKKDTLTEQEKRILQELEEWEESKHQRELEDLRQKLKNGSITEEEQRRLQHLEMMEESKRVKELAELRQKLKNGTISEEEQRRLNELEEQESQQRQLEINMLKGKKNLSAEEAQRLEQLQKEQDASDDRKLLSLQDKIARGEALSEEELKQLDSLEQAKLQKLNDQIESLQSRQDQLSDQEKIKLLQLQQEKVAIELDQLKRKNPPLSEDDQRRLSELQEELEQLQYEELQHKKRMGALTEEEEAKMKELENKLKMNEISQIYKDQENVLDKSAEDNPFAEQNQLNAHQKSLIDKEAINAESAEENSNITNHDNFADLPPVEVLNKNPKQDESLNASQLNQKDLLDGDKANLSGDQKTKELLQQNQLKAASEAKDQGQENQNNGSAPDVQKNQQVIQHTEIKDASNTSGTEGKEEKDKRNLSGDQKANEQDLDLNENEAAADAAAKDAENSQLFNQKEALGQGALNEEAKAEGDQQQQQDGVETKEEQQQLKEDAVQNKGMKDLQEQERALQSEGDAKDAQNAETGNAHEDGQQVNPDGVDNQNAKDSQAIKDHQEAQAENQLQDQQQNLKSNPAESPEADNQVADGAQPTTQQKSQLPEGPQTLVNANSDKDLEAQKQQELAAKEEEEKREAQMQREEDARQEQINSLNQADKNQAESQQKLKEHDQEDTENKQAQRAEANVDPDADKAAEQPLEDQRLESASSQKRNAENRDLQERLGSSGSYNKAHPQSAETQGDAQNQDQENLDALDANTQNEAESADQNAHRDGQMNLKAGSELANSTNDIKGQQERLQSAKSILSERERLKSSQSRRSEQLERIRASTAKRSQMNRSINSSSLEDINSRQGSRQQERDKQNLKDQHLDENFDMNRKETNMVEFGHDDIELDRINEGADGMLEESIYSHQTSTILDEEKVSFMHIEQLPNQDNASDDSFNEQDMVYYNKDDLTNYSKGLGLNRVKAKNGPQYFSENDIQEVNEGEISESGESPRSADTRRRERGLITHKQHQTQEYDDTVDGRVKVDSWNLNYQKKKKRLQKKRNDQDTSKRMHDLQNIYGVDAKTLAGLNKGRLPAQGGAKGYKGGREDTSLSGRNSEMSFRSTQNTFLKQSKLNNLNSKASIDDQSNIFSSNGFGIKSGMSKRWNEIENTLRGSRPDLINNSSNEKFKSDVKRNKFPSTKKLTQTQQKFGNLPSEESKSRSGSRSKNNKVNSTTLKNRQAKNRNGAGARTMNYDSYSESDEGVDNQNALFQKRDGPHTQFSKAAKQQKRNLHHGGMNDSEIDHSESDEGVNDGNANFNGNEFMFTKRPFENSAMKTSNQDGKGKHRRQHGQNRRNNSNEMSDGDNEDLEAQNMTGRRAKNANKHGGSRRNLSDYSDLEISAQRNKRGQGLTNNNSGQKPPLSGQKNKPPRRGQSNTGVDNSEEIARLNNIYGDPYNISGHVHPGVSQKLRHGNADYSEGSVSDRGFNSRGGRKMHRIESHDDLMYHSKNRLGDDIRASQREVRASNTNSAGDARRKRRRSNGSEDNAYIVGPRSLHSSVQPKAYRRGSQGSQDDQDMYSQSQMEREDLEDLDANAGNKFAKKRKIRRAANSTNTRDAEFRKLQAAKNERLRRKQREAESALFSKDDDEGMIKQKKKKKQKDTVRKEVNYWLDYDSPYAEYLVARFKEWAPNSKGAHQRGTSARPILSDKYQEIQNAYQRNDMDSSRQHSAQKHSYSRDRQPLHNQTQHSQEGYHPKAQGQRKVQKKNQSKERSTSNNERSAFSNQLASQQVQNLFVEDIEEP